MWRINRELGYARGGEDASRRWRGALARPHRTGAPGGFTKSRRRAAGQRGPHQGPVAAARRRAGGRGRRERRRRRAGGPRPRDGRGRAGCDRWSLRDVADVLWACARLDRPPAADAVAALCGARAGGRAPVSIDATD